MRKQIILSHGSVKEYLLSDMTGSSAKAATFSFSEIHARKLISNACLSYLLSSTHTALDLRMDSFPLLIYITEFWYNHLKAVDEIDETPDSIAYLATELFDTKWSENGSKGHNTMTANSAEGPQAVHYENPCFPRPLYYASIVGLNKIVRILIDRGDNADEIGGFCGTPL